MLFILSRLKEKRLEYTEYAEVEMLSRLDKELVKHNPRVTILGVGNLLLKDEGVGIHIVQELSSKIDDMNVNIVDGGTSAK